MSNPISFQDWVRLVFDHPSDGKRHWSFALDANVEPVPPPTFIEYGARLFSESGVVLHSYSDAQVDQGLNAMVNNSMSDNVFALQDKSIPIDRRANFLRAILDLNTQVFETRCSAHLSHLDRNETPAGVSPLNAISYMWWDIFVPPGRELNEICLSVMENSLKLSNLAVLEGALHGLGHWSPDYPERCKSIIQEFLKRKGAHIPLELRKYAIAAQTGCIL